MRNLLLITTLFTSLTAFSQTPKKIVLKKGQTITVSVTSNTDADMGMGMAMKNNTTQIKKLIIIDENNDTYKLTSAITHVKLSMENPMGQNMDFDSDKAEDADNEMGKVWKEKLSLQDTLLLDKRSGNTTSFSKIAESEDKPMDGMLNAMGSNLDIQTVRDAFLMIPANKKVGESWIDSSTVKGLTNKKIYTLKSFDKNFANITTITSVEGTTNEEIQGMTATININSKATSEIIVDTNTGIVSKIIEITEATTNIDMMGQTMPMSSKGTSTTIFQY